MISFVYFFLYTLHLRTVVILHLYDPTALGGCNTRAKAKRQEIDRVKDADPVRVSKLSQIIDNAPDISNKMDKLCPVTVDALCQSNADSDGTRPVARTRT